MTNISWVVVWLTFDTEYQQKKLSVHRAHPRHIGQGLKQGFTELGRGIFSGVTGLVMQPYIEAKKNGIKGGIIGTGKGILNLYALQTNDLIQ